MDLFLIAYFHHHFTHLDFHHVHIGVAIDAGFPRICVFSCEACSEISSFNHWLVLNLNAS